MFSDTQAYYLQCVICNKRLDIPASEAQKIIESEEWSKRVILNNNCGKPDEWSHLRVSICSTDCYHKLQKAVLLCQCTGDIVESSTILMENKDAGN